MRRLSNYFCIDVSGGNPVISLNVNVNARGKANIGSRQAFLADLPATRRAVTIAAGFNSNVVGGASAVDPRKMRFVTSSNS